MRVWAGCWACTTGRLVDVVAVAVAFVARRVAGWDDPEVAFDWGVCAACDVVAGLVVVAGLAARSSAPCWAL